MYLRSTWAGDVEDYKTRRARLGLINISGLAARTAGTPSGSIRNVAVAALTKNLADELSRSGINVTVVHPESP